MRVHFAAPHARDFAKLEAYLKEDGSSLRSLVTKEETEGGQDRSNVVLFHKS
jgi:hypothetical protein